MRGERQGALTPREEKCGVRQRQKTLNTGAAPIGKACRIVRGNGKRGSSLTRRDIVAAQPGRGGLKPEKPWRVSGQAGSARGSS